MFASLREVTGGNALLWNEPQWQRRFSADLLRNRMHEKLLVVDGDKLLMGGMNVADDYLQGGVTRKGWHDTDVLIEGPAAAEAQKVFLKVWELSRYLDSAAPFPPFEKEETKLLQKLFYEDDGRFQVRPPAQGGKKPALVDAEIPFRKYLGDPFYFPALAPRPEWTTPLRFIYDNTLVDRNPRTGRQVSKIMDTLIYLIRMSRSSVLLFVPYLTPHEDFLAELEKAAKAGKTVVVVTNSERSHDIGTIPWKAGTSHYGPLLEAGVHLFEWQGHADLLEIEKANGCTIPEGQWPGRTIHSKVAVVDGQVCLVGSHNFNVQERVAQQRGRGSLPEPRGRAAARTGLRRRPRPGRGEALRAVRRIRLRPSPPGEADPPRGRRALRAGARRHGTAPLGSPELHVGAGSDPAPPRGPRGLLPARGRPSRTGTTYRRTAV